MRFIVLKKIFTLHLILKQFISSELPENALDNIVCALPKHDEILLDHSYTLPLKNIVQKS